MFMSLMPLYVQGKVFWNMVKGAVSFAFAKSKDTALFCYPMVLAEIFFILVLCPTEHNVSNTFCRLGLILFDDVAVKTFGGRHIGVSQLL